MDQHDLVYGLRPVQEALKGQPSDLIEIRVARGRHGRAVALLLEEARRLKISVVYRQAEALSRQAGHDHHQGLIAMIKGFEYTPFGDLLDSAAAQTSPLIVAADCIQDPGNLGAILRSAHALGAIGVIIPKDRAVGVTPTVRKASAGALTHTPVAQVTNMARAIRALFDKAGLWPIGLVPEAKQDLTQVDMTLPLTLVVGSEGKGIRPAVLKACEVKAKIPLLGKVASLNVSAAAAIACYEVARQRALESKG